MPAKRELVRPAALCGLAYARIHHARTGGPAESTLAQGRYLTATGRQSCTRDRINCPPQACQRQRQRCRPRAREAGLRDLGPPNICICRHSAADLLDGARCCPTPHHRRAARGRAALARATKSRIIYLLLARWEQAGGRA